MRRQQKASISPFLLLTLLGIAIAVTSCADANVGTTPGGNQQVEDVTPDESNTSSDADATDSTASDTRDLAGDDQGEGEDQVGEPDESEVPEDLGNQGGEDIPFIPDVVEEVHVVVGSCPADGVNICKTPTNNVLEQFGPKNEAITFRVINWRTDRLILQYSGDDDMSLNGWSLWTRHGKVNFPNGYTLGPASRVSVYLTESGTNDDTHIFFGNEDLDLGEFDELAMFSVQNENNYSDENIEAYVRWGGPVVRFRQSVIGLAVEADMWTSEDSYVRICDSADAIIITSYFTDPESYFAEPDNLASCNDDMPEDP